MRQYRIFIKDSLNLTDRPVSTVVCPSFTVKRDLLGSASSTFNPLEIDSNVKEGDILGLIDPYGSILYTGVIKSIGDNIQTQQMVELFHDKWKWYDPADATIEGKIKTILETDYTQSTDPMVADRFPYTVSTTSSTPGTFEQHTVTVNQQEVPSQKYVTDLMKFLFDLYDQWGVIVDVHVPYEANTPTISIGQATGNTVKIGNNVNPITDMTALTEIFETNRLFIYNKDGDTLRATYYGTTGGITSDPTDPLRLPVTKTKYVFDTDKDPAEIVSEHLQEEMLNHKLEFSMLLDNNLYQFFDWNLGQTIEIWYNGNYYSTLFTGYTFRKQEGSDLTSVDVVCGKVRNTLTEILNRSIND